jgi:hypothetical protein
MRGFCSKDLLKLLPVFLKIIFMITLNKKQAFPRQVPSQAGAWNGRIKAWGKMS